QEAVDVEGRAGADRERAGATDADAAADDRGAGERETALDVEQAGRDAVHEGGEIVERGVVVVAADNEMARGDGAEPAAVDDFVGSEGERAGGEDAAVVDESV